MDCIGHVHLLEIALLLTKNDTIRDLVRKAWQALNKARAATTAMTHICEKGLARRIARCKMCAGLHNMRCAVGSHDWLHDM